MEQTKITILLPNHNFQNCITKCLNSILSQNTTHKYKILIIDDYSTDNSVKIIKKFLKKYPEKIEFIQNNKNLRCLGTLLKGYELIKTDYFCVLDPDDYWIDKQKIQKAIDFLDKHKNYTIYIANNYIKEKNKEPVPYFNSDSKDFDFNNLDNAIFGHTSGTVFRNVVFTKKIPKVIYDSIGNADERVYEGDSFRTLLHLKYGKAHFESKVGSVYCFTHKGIWTSLDIFQQNTINARFFLKMYIFFKENKDYFIRMGLGFCLNNLDILNKSKPKIINNTVVQFEDIFIQCLKNKIPKLNYKNKLRLSLLSYSLKSAKSPSIHIKILNKIATLKDI